MLYCIRIKYQHVIISANAMTDRNERSSHDKAKPLAHIVRTMLVRAMLVYAYVLKRWGEATGFAFHGAGVSAVQLLMRPTQ